MSTSRTAWRWIGTWLAVGAVLIAGIAAAPGARAESLGFRYVSWTGEISWTGPGSSQTPAGPLAPTGSFQFTSAGGSFTLLIDDVAVLDGRTIPVFVWQTRADGTTSSTRRCVLAREPVEIASTAGSRVTVALVNELYWLGKHPSNDPHCTAGARAGTAYVGL